MLDLIPGVSVILPVPVHALFDGLRERSELEIRQVLSQLSVAGGLFELAVCLRGIKQNFPFEIVGLDQFIG